MSRSALFGLLAAVLLVSALPQPAAHGEEAEAPPVAVPEAAAPTPEAALPEDSAPETAAPDDPDDPYNRFIHRDHRTRFLEAKLTCLACHPIGMTTGTDDFLAVKKVDELVLVPSRELCHDCHTGALRYPRAPSRCDSCHTNLTGLLPEDHDPGWDHDHGWAALRYGSSCDLCHPVSECNTCHARRDESQHRVHPPSFRATHGIEARMDPARCSRCHLQSTCESCHAGRGL